MIDPHANALVDKRGVVIADNLAEHGVGVGEEYGVVVGAEALHVLKHLSQESEHVDILHGCGVERAEGIIPDDCVGGVKKGSPEAGIDHASGLCLQRRVEGFRGIFENRGDSLAYIRTGLAGCAAHQLVVGVGRDARKCLLAFSGLT